MNNKEDEVSPVEQIWNRHIVFDHALINHNAGCALEMGTVKSRTTPVAGRKSEQLAGGTGEAKESVLAMRVHEETVAEERLKEASEVHLSIPGRGSKEEIRSHSAICSLCPTLFT